MSSTRRTLRVAREIKELVSRVLILELADPRMGFITVTEVDVAPDMQTAVVKVSVLGGPSDADLCLRAIEHARGRIQSEVNGQLPMKTVPRLTFVIDESVKKSVELSRLLNQARAEYRTPLAPGEVAAESAAGETAGEEDDNAADDRDADADEDADEDDDEEDEDEDDEEEEDEEEDEK